MSQIIDITKPFSCENFNCVFCNNGLCKIPQTENFNLYDDNNEFHCINYITDINDVSKESRYKYNL